MRNNYQKSSTWEVAVLTRWELCLKVCFPLRHIIPVHMLIAFSCSKGRYFKTCLLAIILHLKYDKFYPSRFHANISKKVASLGHYNVPMSVQHWIINSCMPCKEQDRECNGRDGKKSSNSIFFLRLRKNAFRK